MGQTRTLKNAPGRQIWAGELTIEVREQVNGVERRKVN